MATAAYQRVVLKLSGESLGAPDGQGLDFARARDLAAELAGLGGLGCGLLVVVGGGNLLRGRDARAAGLDAVQADRIGMLATAMNAIALGALLRAAGAAARVLTATPIAPLAEPYTSELARAALDGGEIVLSAGGLGHPFFSTDTAAALRAIEVGADCLLKATTVDGVYSSDPRRDPGAVRLPRLSFDEVLERRLAVMDATAFALCRDNGIPIRVFDFSQPGALARVLRGEALGSLVSQEAS
ncbi:UMP kinase [bacterium]|nr:UMP kinase [bacterium]